jgi:hypothetical protein
MIRFAAAMRTSSVWAVGIGLALALPSLSNAHPTMGVGGTGLGAVLGVGGTGVVGVGGTGLRTPSNKSAGVGGTGLGAVLGVGGTGFRGVPPAARRPARRR